MRDIENDGKGYVVNNTMNLYLTWFKPAPNGRRSPALHPAIMTRAKRWIAMHPATAQANRASRNA